MPPDPCLVRFGKQVRGSQYIGGEQLFPVLTALVVVPEIRRGMKNHVDALQLARKSAQVRHFSDNNFYRQAGQVLCCLFAGTRQCSYVHSARHQQAHQIIPIPSLPSLEPNGLAKKCYCLSSKISSRSNSGKPASRPCGQEGRESCERSPGMRNAMSVSRRSLAIRSSRVESNTYPLQNTVKARRKKYWLVTGSSRTFLK